MINREIYLKKPHIINYVQQGKKDITILQIATRNENKLREYQRILTNYEIIGKDLKVPEIQSLDPYKVAEEKAKFAWEKNEYNPIVIEDVSLEMLGLGGRPGTYIVDFCEEVEMRRMIAEDWLKGKDRRALARAIIGIYDGKEFQYREGKVEGKISEKLLGTNGFGWDDMFIPKGETRTFAEMSDKEKDTFSMRHHAIEELKRNPFQINYPVLMLPEPYNSELKRLRLDELQDSKAIKFAFSLEALGENNKINDSFETPNYEKIQVEKNKFFGRFLNNIKSSSLGLIFTDIDRGAVKLYENGNPYLWQMGPKRRKLALAQRAEYFLENQNSEVHDALDIIEKTGIPFRNNARSLTIENALSTVIGHYTKTKALKEIGYKKISSKKEVSRTKISDTGLYNKVGKYARSIFGIGSMPPVSGWRDVLVTAAIGHMPVFTHRNSLNEAYPSRQINLIREAKEVLQTLKLTKIPLERAERNIGAAVGCGNVKEEVTRAKNLYTKAGVKLFRIYTINGDPRVINVAKAFRQEFGDDIEIFAGQIADKEQALALIAPDIAVDALVFGHGGGMQCTSATNGMALTTLEEIYDIAIDNRFNNTTIAAEGGIGTSVGALFVLGVDLILTNQKFVKGCIELTDIFFEHKDGGFCHPYHGSASAPTMLIESVNEDLMRKRMYASGRAKKVEGKPGYSFYREKANAMAFHVNEYKHYAARTLADLGVENFSELRNFLYHNDKELLRIISTEASYIAQPHSA